MTQLCCLVQTFFVALLTKFQSLSKSSGANTALSSGANTALSSGANTALSSGANTAQYCDPVSLTGTGESLSRVVLRCG